jgi:hypothetical protein
MRIHLRQICLVAESLEPAVKDLSAILGIRTCHVDPEVGKWGLQNALLPVGKDFLEVVAPVQNDTSAGRHLTRRSGDGGYMVICQVPTKQEQDAARARATANQVRVAYESDRKSWRLMQLHPGDMQGAYLEIDWDEQADPEGNWMPAGGTDWQEHISTEIVKRITGVELQGDDPQAMADHWAAICGAVVETREGPPTVPLSNAVLRFVQDFDGRGPGLGGIDLSSNDAGAAIKIARERGCLGDDGQIIICGTRINLT